MRRLILIVLLGTAALARTAGAGGFATVQLSTLPAERTWSVDLTILQHGRTPLDGLQPTVRIWREDESHTFPARPTGRPGVYHARVVFPARGTWRFEVADGFTQTHHYAPVEIGPAPTGGSFPIWPVLGGLLGAAGLTGLALALRRARPVPAVR
jgi:hypothetical protein